MGTGRSSVDLMSFAISIGRSIPVSRTGRTRNALWTPNANVEWRTRLYQIDSQRDWRNAEAYVYNPRTGLIDRSGNTQITHNQDQTGLTSTLRVQGTAGGLQNNFAVGLDANRAHFKHTNNTYAGSSGPVDPFDPVPGQFASDAPNLPRYRNRAEQYALFVEDRLALRNAVPKLALDAPLPGGGKLRDIAPQVLDIASAGLQARARLDASGSNETGFLDPLREIVRSGKVPAQVLLDRYHGAWHGDVGRVYSEESF